MPSDFDTAYEMGAFAGSTVRGLAEEVFRLRAEQERLSWNLAGCTLLAESRTLTDFKRDGATPGLLAVEQLLKDLLSAQSRGRVLEEAINQIKVSYGSDAQQRLGRIMTIVYALPPEGT